MTTTTEPDTRLESGSAPVLDAVEALSGFCRLTRRSGTLEGSLPLRAAQHCTPVVLGSAAGFQVVLHHPIVLHRGRSGVILTLTRPGAARMQRDVTTALARVVDRGWLERDGHWQRLFCQAALPLRGDHLLLWTGWLIRPAAETTLLVSGAYNRRSHVAIREHLVTDVERFTPLVLEIDVSDLGTRPTWLEGEVGCVTPLVPAVRFATRPLAAVPEVATFVRRFYDPSYFEEKQRGPTGRYRKLHATLSSDAPPRADCQLVRAGPNVHRIVRRWRCAGPDGWGTWTASKDRTLEQAVVGSECSLEANWDGHAVRVVRSHTMASRRRFSRLWHKIHGVDAEAALDSFREGFVRLPLDEPYLAVLPWVFVTTPPGWSSIVDGFHGPIYDGMRGVIDTDVFATVSTVFRFHRLGRMRIPKAAPLFRVLPIPRALLRRPLRQFDLDAGSPAS